jgi:mandelate racemase
MKIRDIRTVGVEVPMTFALGTSRGVITKAPLLLVDLVTSEAVTGRAYLWCYFREVMPAVAGILRTVLETLQGDAVAPLELNA